jgi:hypothetical protein
MGAEVEERVVQEMAEGDDDQHATKRDERVARTQAEDDQRAGDEFDERNGNADEPQRPDRQEGVSVRQKIFSHVLERSELKDFHDTGHEEDEAQYEPGEEQRPSAIEIWFHLSELTVRDSSTELGMTRSTIDRERNRDDLKRLDYRVL